MSRTVKLAASSCLTVLLAPGVIQGEDTLRMPVSPAVSRAPAVLTIRVDVEPSPENQTLQVTAESPTFYRSSEVELTGETTPLQILEYRNVPAGTYQVTAVVIGRDGPRGKALQLVKVEPSIGSR
jgi:hypothetical protein